MPVHLKKLTTVLRKDFITYLVMEATSTTAPEDMVEAEVRIREYVDSLSDIQVIKEFAKELGVPLNLIEEPEKDES